MRTLTVASNTLAVPETLTGLDTCCPMTGVSTVIAGRSGSSELRVNVDPSAANRTLRMFAYWVSDPRTFHTKVSGTRELYGVADIEGQLRNTIIGRISDAFANSNVPFLDMAANQVALSQKIADFLKPMFTALGLTLDTFVVENLSLPDELQKRLDERIGMNMVGDMGRYTQFQVAQSMPIAAANEGGGAAGVGVGLGAGLTMAQQMMNAMKPGAAPPAEPAAGTPAATPETKFCQECGKSIPRSSKFCPECGKPQQ